MGYHDAAEDHGGMLRLKDIEHNFGKNVARMVEGLSDSLTDVMPFGEQLAGDAGTTHKFTGKERDTESGLDNFGARFDASNLGRFMSPEPVGGHQEDPQTMNRYSYVRNNPLNLTDPTGLDFYLQCVNKNHEGCTQVKIADGVPPRSGREETRS